MNESVNRYASRKPMACAAAVLVVSALLIVPTGALAKAVVATKPAPTAKSMLPPPPPPPPTKAPSKPTKPTKTEEPAPAPAPAPAPTPAPSSTSFTVDPPATLKGDDYSSLGGVFVASTGEAWAVGSQRAEGTEGFAALAEEWTGSSWKAFPTANLGVSSSADTGLSSVSGTGPDDVWVVGANSSSETALIEHFNGTSWTAEGPASGEPAESSLASVSADSTTDVWAVGSSPVVEAHNTGRSPLIEHFNGSSWSVVQGAFTGNEEDTLSAVDAISPADVWALGTARGRSYSGPGKSVLEHYNGTEWTIVGELAMHVDSISASSPENLWAVGEQGGTAAIEHYNGSSWTATPITGLEGTSGSRLTGVTTISGSEAWAVGALARKVTEDGVEGAGTETGELTVKWNGTSWTVVPTSAEEGAGAVSGIAGGPLFAVGANNGNNDAYILQGPTL